MRSLRFLAGISACSMLSACAGTTFPHPLDTVARSHRIVVIPLEPPPLYVVPGVSVPAGTAMSTGASMTIIPDAATQAAGAGIWALGGIMMLLSAPAMKRETIRVGAAADEILSSSEPWTPTIGLAAEASQTLVASGCRSISLSSVLPLNGVKVRGRTLSMMNWYDPIDDWYTLEKSPYEYGPFGVAEDDYVLEVEMASSIPSPGLICVTSNAKLIDPSTGQVLARAAALAQTSCKELPALFSEGGKGLKAMLLQLGMEALAKDLAEMGLLTVPSSSPKT